MCTKAECQRHVGQWVRFQTPYGHHQGIIERINGDKAIILSPKQYVPVQFASTDVCEDDMGKLDVALAWWGGAGRGYPNGAAGYRGGAYGYPGGYGYRGVWARWAVSFLVIYALWGLFLW
ncbi:hypothetical protein [Alicyclobacillus fodiniaquatilis]|uniref:Uncharacterized protein n=1 Tax=Alicyclobacillus fodiniaquatilis TaxID=1661150 RepID=A0ABW4JPG2_9BACL